MPPRKETRPVPQGEPGLAKRHVAANYETLPEVAAELKCGHVLLISLTVGLKHKAETGRQLKQHFPSEMLPSNVQPDILRTLNRYKKFHQLNSGTEFRKFVLLCEEPFLRPRSSRIKKKQPVPQEESTSQLPAGEAQEGEEQLTPSGIPPPSAPQEVQSPGLRSSRTPLTPQMVQLKQRLQFMYHQKAQMMKKHTQAMQALRARLKTPKRVVNQALKRKIAIIKSLKEKLRGHSMAVELVKTRQELQKLKKAHHALKVHHKKQRASLIPSSRHKCLQAQLRELKSRLSYLENENLMLKEQVETLQERLGEAGVAVPNECSDERSGRKRDGGQTNCAGVE